MISNLKTQIATKVLPLMVAAVMVIPAMPTFAQARPAHMDLLGNDGEIHNLISPVHAGGSITLSLISPVHRIVEPEPTPGNMGTEEYECMAFREYQTVCRGG
jgi:hypothetical protein